MARKVFEVNVDDREAHKAIRRMLKMHDDLRPTLLKPLMYPAMLDTYREWMDSQGGGSWPPLTPKYAKWKSSHAPGSKMLQYQGGLYQSLTEENAKRSGSGAGQVRRFEQRRLTVGTTWNTAHLHESGRGGAVRRITPPYPLLNRHLEKAMREWATTQVPREWQRGA